MKHVMLLVAVLLTGCAGSGSGDIPGRTYDLGIEAPAARFSAVRVAAVRAAAPFDTNDMLYRLAYRDAAELHAFSQSRWAATPAVLLQRRFARASGNTPVTCLFEFELSELSQVFQSTSGSEIVLEGRASLLAGSRRVADRVFLVVEREAGGTAASGAHAVTRAVDRVIGEISAWSAQSGACKAG
jgi:cholesterol transport system auxiliary component